MINENEPCLKFRKQMSADEETECKYYLKKFRGYIRSTFINVQTVGLFLTSFMISVVLVLMYLLKRDEAFLYLIGGIFGFAMFVICCIIIIKLWFWKYTKYVVVTNEGIWLMWHGAFWRKTDFAGKRRFLSPIWSLYGWSEIKITDDENARPKSSDKISTLFENFDFAVIKSTRLVTLFLTRFDGVQQVDFLDASDANQILAYAQEKKRKKRKKKKAESTDLTEVTEVTEDEQDISDENVTEDIG